MKKVLFFILIATGLAAQQIPENYIWADTVDKMMLVTRDSFLHYVDAKPYILDTLKLRHKYPPDHVVIAHTDSTETTSSYLTFDPDVNNSRGSFTVGALKSENDGVYPLFVGFNNANSGGSLKFKQFGTGNSGIIMDEGGGYRASMGINSSTNNFHFALGYDYLGNLSKEPTLALLQSGHRAVIGAYDYNLTYETSWVDGSYDDLIIGRYGSSSKGITILGASNCGIAFSKGSSASDKKFFYIRGYAYNGYTTIGVNGSTTSMFIDNSTSKAGWVTFNSFDFPTHEVDFAKDVRMRAKLYDKDNNYTEGKYLKATSTGVQWADATGGSGEANDGANVGTGTGTVFRDKTGTTLNFKTIKAGSNITITNGADDITIDASGEANTASNVGTGGANVFKQKTGVDLEFRQLKAGSNITVTENANDITIDATSSSPWTRAGTGDVYLNTLSDFVGVGTSTPDRRFHVLANSSGGQQVAKFENTGTGSCYVNVGSNLHYWGLRVDNDGLFSIHDYNSTGGIGQRMAIDESGYMGVGTTSPNYLLHVSGGYTNLGMFESTSGGSLYVKLRNSSGTEWSHGINSGKYTIYDYDASGGSGYRLTIDQSGYVGINTDFPTERLDVNGHIRMRGLIYDFNDWAGNNGDVLTKVTGGVEWQSPSGSNYNVVSLRMNNSQEWHNTSYTKVDFNGVDYDYSPDMSYSLSSDRITINTSGDYKVTVVVNAHTTNTSGCGVEHRVYINGFSQSRKVYSQLIGTNSMLDATSSYSFVENFTAGDYVELYVQRQDNLSSISITGSTVSRSILMIERVR